MPLGANALFTLTELKGWLQIKDSSSNLDTNLSLVGDVASDKCEKFCDRQFITRGALIDLHTIGEGIRSIWTRQYPILTLTDVSEDEGRTYTTSLANGSDYIVNMETGRIDRVSGVCRLEWRWGVDVVRVRYTAGFANAAAVPLTLKAVALDLAAMIWRQNEKELLNVVTVTDETGTVTRFSQARITKEMERDLEPFKRKRSAPATGRAA